jgi:hypothetical protein
MSQQTELRVLRGDIIHGPFSLDQIRALVARGRLSEADLVSVRGGPWVRISECLEPSQPPVQVQPIQTPSPVQMQPIQLQSPPELSLSEMHHRVEVRATSSALDQPNALVWVYRALLVIAVIGIASPWYEASSSMSAPLVGTWGSRASISGLSVAWGLVSLLLLVAGEITSFLSRSWQVLCGLAVASVGVVAVAAVQLSSAGSFGVNAESSFAGAAATAKVGLTWGIWLTLAASSAAAGVACFSGLPAITARIEGRVPRTSSLPIIAIAVVAGGVTAFGLLLLILWSGVVPDGSGTSSQRGSQGTRRAEKSGNSASNKGRRRNSAAEARRELFETANKMEGPFSEAVEEYIRQVENGNWSWNMLDEYFLPGKFTPETIAAYRQWRAAKLAESEKKR